MGLTQIKKMFKVSVVVMLALSKTYLASAEEKLPKEFEGVTIKEHLGSQVDLSVPFVDSDGKNVKIGDYFRDGKPVLLTLNYYECKTLCNLQLNAVVEGLRGLNWPVGERFRVVTISIDPRNNSNQAKEKQVQHLKSLGQPKADWNFLTGTEQNIRKIANTVGYDYKYIKEVQEYVHGLGIFFMSPKGVVSRYLYGLTYKPLDLRLALLDAADGKTATTIDKFIMTCFHYNATDGQYTPAVVNIMRFGGMLAVTILGSSMAIMWRNDKRRHREESATCS